MAKKKVKTELVDEVETPTNEVVPEDTVEPTLKEELIIERDELKSKIVKLSNAVGNNLVPKSEVGILTQQLNAMHTYLVILNRRLK